MTNKEQTLMQKIYETGLAMDDIVLYLDTHPSDKAAFQYYLKIQNQLLQYKTEYNMYYGPLTNENVYANKNCDYSKNSAAIWTWVQTPMPWERGC